MLVRSLDVDVDNSNLEGRQNFNIHQLAKFTEYAITISCKTSAGHGPYSDPPEIVKTLEDSKYSGDHPNLLLISLSLWL